MLEAKKEERLRFVHTLLLAVVTLGPGCDEADEAGTEEMLDTGEALMCPTHIRTERVSSLVKHSFGWNGMGHNAEVVEGGAVSYALFECDDECRLCRFHGPVANIDADLVPTKRCVNELTQACESDGECPDSSCQYVFGPPTQRVGIWNFEYAAPLTSEEMDAFGTEEADGIQGVVNLRSGELDFTINNGHVGVGFGASTSCVGDVTPNDGEKDGTCDDASGDPCDTNAISREAALSYDCAFAPVMVDLTLPGHGMGTSGTRWEMDDSRPFCTAEGATDQRCWCGVCDDDIRVPCRRDTDCPGSSCGGVDGPELPMPTVQNPCAAGQSCNWDPVAKLGTCEDAEGAMALCFPADGELIAEGSTSVQDGFFVAGTALLNCIPHVDPMLDAQFGFPGPRLQQIPLKVTPEFRE